MDKAGPRSQCGDDNTSPARVWAAFLQDVALGKRVATNREVNKACKQLDRYLSEPVLEDL